MQTAVIKPIFADAMGKVNENGFGAAEGGPSLDHTIGAPDDSPDEEDRLQMITEAGGIVPLVALLTSAPGMAAKEHAQRRWDILPWILLINLRLLKPMA